MFLSESLVYIFVCIYYQNISKDWIYIQIPNIALTVMGICFLFVMPETPRFLLVQGKTQQAKEVFAKIAKINGLSPNLVDRFEFVYPKQPQTSELVMD